ncbi:MAG: phage tail tape measure protein [Bacteroidota bacterium]
MSGKGRITRNDIAEKKVFSVGKDFAESLQPGIEATEKWEAALRELKSVAIEYSNIEKQFKVADGRKEFLQIKQQEENLRKRAAEAIKAEHNALVAKQKAIIAAIQTEKQKISLESKKNRVQSQSIKLTEKEKYELRILNRGKREAAKISSTLSTEYEKQSIILTKLRRRYKDVALTQGTSGKEAKRLRKRILELDAALKKVDANVGQFQRNVGNYTRAMQNAKAAANSLASAMGVMGGTFLVAAVIKDAIQVIRDFEKQNATLSAVLQVEREEMKGLTDDAVRLGETTVKTAGQVTGLQISLARLGFTQQEILDLTESTISGSIAMNSELDKTAELVGAVVNTFDDLSTTDAPQIIDILSLSTAKSALEFKKLETGLPIVAGAANAAGISFNRLVALMGKLTDSGIDISASSTSLRNIFIESAAQGLNYEQILEKIKKSQDKLTASNDEFGKRASVSATILANNIDTTKELEETLNNAAGTAERMANKELDTLDGSIKLLRSAWEGYILKLNDSTEAGIALKDGIGFLARNLDILIPLVTYAVKAWVTYKAALYLASIQQKIMAANVAFSNRNLALQRLGAIRAAQGLNQTSVASIRASLAFKKLGDVLKANLFGLVATGLAALIYYLSETNKSLSENIETTNEATKAFIEQREEQEKQSNTARNLADRYDELSDKSEKLGGKTKLNKKEQKELDDIIVQLSKDFPEAISKVNDYGKA